MNKKLIHIAVGVIKRGNEIFICKRPDDKHQGGKWEFPGGKVEKNESVIEALTRELKEEIDIQVNTSVPFQKIEHDYGDKYVLLDIHLVTDFNGTAKGNEGQQSCWVEIESLHNYQFPVANKPILEKLYQLFA